MPSLSSKAFAPAAATYVMAYSASADMKRAVQFMRAGVREFFTLPLDANEVSAALTALRCHRATPPPRDDNDKKTGKLFVFSAQKAVAA